MDSPMQTAIAAIFGLLHETGAGSGSDVASALTSCRRQTGSIRLRPTQWSALPGWGPVGSSGVLTEGCDRSGRWISFARQTCHTPCRRKWPVFKGLAHFGTFRAIGATRGLL